MADVMFEPAYPHAKRAAWVRARAAVRTRAISQADCEDLEQEAMVAFLRALPQFDSSRAQLRTFVELVITTGIASALRRQRVLQRVPAYEAQLQCCRRPTESIELRRDVERVLAVLTAEDRRLALLLTEQTPTEASRQLGVSRSTVYKGIGRVRLALANAGLDPHKSGRRS